MHVGLNLLFLVPDETGGMEVYARELIPELIKASPGTRFTAFINREAAAAGGGSWGEFIESVTVPINARHRTEWVRGEQQLIPPLATRLGVDLVHSLASTAPAWGRFRRVVTIHDLNYRIVPESHLGVLGWGMRVLVPLAARRSHRIIAPARATQQDLERLLNIAPAKIDVVHEGVGAGKRVPPLPESELRAKLGAGERRIVLDVSAKRPHKNLLRLVGALGLIAPERRPLLVIPGYPTRHEEELRARAHALGVSDDIRFLGWIEPAELEGLYASAACFVFPSLYEGFGLPVLEAMARGVPVACSGRGALSEVAGDAALFFDPESEWAIAEAIERVLEDRATADGLRAAGLRRASQFSWTEAARGTLAAYERAISDPRT